MNTSDISMSVINVELDGAIHEFALHIDQVMQARFKRNSVLDNFSLDKVEVYSDNKTVIETAIQRMREYLRNYDVSELNLGNDKVSIKM